MSDPKPYVRKLPDGSMIYFGQSCTEGTQHNGQIFGGTQDDGPGAGANPISSSPEQGSSRWTNQRSQGGQSFRRGNGTSDAGRTGLHIDGHRIACMKGRHTFGEGTSPNALQKPGGPMIIDWQSKFSAHYHGQISEEHERTLKRVGTLFLTTSQLEKKGDPIFSASWPTEETTTPPCAGQAAYRQQDTQGAETKREAKREDDYAQRLRDLEARERTVESRERDLKTREKTLQFEKATHDMAEERLKRLIAGSRSGEASVKDQQESAKTEAASAKGEQGSAKSEAASATTQAASAGIDQASASSEQGSRKFDEPTREELQREAVLRQKLSLWRSRS